MIVYDPSNSSIKEWHGLSIVLPDTTTAHYIGNFTVTQEGNYAIWANGTGCLIILFCWFWFWVFSHPCKPVPESPFTVEVMTLLALLGLSAFKRLKMRR